MINRYIEQLQELYDGENWLDESYQNKLAGITSKQAFREPLPGFHSIAGIVWHCIYWRRVFMAYAQGDQQFRDKTIATQNFLPADKLRAMGWSELKSELKISQKKLIQLLKGLNDDFLGKEYKPGHSFSWLLEGIIQHDAYHLGQLGLVKKILAV
jgi:uncharacterized damage-inducible protein DinB